MKDRPFHRAVVLECRLGRYRYVLTVKDAARVLLREWPDASPGAKHAAACVAALAALKGGKSPAHARRALVAAAKEAGILSTKGLEEFETAFPDRIGRTLPPGRSAQHGQA
jgi:Protein of unknown function (DUF982).